MEKAETFLARSIAEKYYPARMLPRRILLRTRIPKKQKKKPGSGPCHEVVKRVLLRRQDLIIFPERNDAEVPESKDRDSKSLTLFVDRSKVFFFFLS